MRRTRISASSHPAEAASKVNKVSKPDNMDNRVVVSKVVVSTAAKKKRETWKTTRKISVPERPELRIVAARIAS